MINYRRIADAVEYYESLGYKRVESPWIVDIATDAITRPEESNAIILQEEQKSLVGSGEQSLLQLKSQKELPSGKYVTVTPCFRDEGIEDEFHLPYFMKVELMISGSSQLKDLINVISDAKSFYSRYFVKNELEFVSTEVAEEVDISIEGIELGSYGIRKTKNHHWIYGTGCAEPRTQQAYDIYGVSCF